jgi:hypothetical protein
MHYRMSVQARVCIALILAVLAKQRASSGQKSLQHLFRSRSWRSRRLWGRRWIIAIVGNVVMWSAVHLLA